MKERTVFDKVDGVIYKVLRCISYAATVFLVAIMLVSFINVLLEKLHQVGVPVNGIPNTVNWVQYMNVCVVYLATAYVTLERGHSGLDLLTRHYPKWLQKAFAILAYACGTVVIGYISYLGYIKVFAVQLERNTRINETLATAFPAWPFGLVYFAGMGLLAFSCLWAIVRICANRPVATEGRDIEEETRQKLAEDAAKAEEGGEA